MLKQIGVAVLMGAIFYRFGGHLLLLMPISCKPAIPRSRDPAVPEARTPDTHSSCWYLTNGTYEAVHPALHNPTHYSSSVIACSTWTNNPSPVLSSFFSPSVNGGSFFEGNKYLAHIEAGALDTITGTIYGIIT